MKKLCHRLKIVGNTRDWHYLNEFSRVYKSKGNWEAKNFSRISENLIGLEDQNYGLKSSREDRTMVGVRLFVFLSEVVGILKG